jgi:hypothetical protein
MDDKLTIRLDKATLEQAKQYAKANHSSWGRMIEDYLAATIARSNHEEEVDISPFVRSLASKVKSSDTINAKEVYHKYLYRKHR